MVDGSLWVLWLLPPLKLVAMILLKVALNTKDQSIKTFV
jgi:cytochrome c-type biogenesis protein CcmH/NrfF